MSKHKVSFHTTWNESDEEFFRDIKRQTPAESGRWENIVGGCDKNEADYHIVFNNMRSDINSSDTLLYSAEPPSVVSMYKNWDKYSTRKKFPIKSYYKPQRWWVKKNYDQLNQTKPPNKTRDLSWITTDKGKDVGSIHRAFCHIGRNAKIKERSRRYLLQKVPFISTGPLDGHILRMNFYDQLASEYPNLLDLYGRGNFVGRHYKGEIDDKWSALEEYRYSICIENYRGKNYFSEKISDALLAWCMPIYWGCTNLSDFLPEDSYIYVDIESKDAPEKIKSIVKSKKREKNISAIADARQRILDQYQIWPTVSQHINNL
jgi:hypothetical protein